MTSQDILVIKDNDKIKLTNLVDGLEESKIQKISKTSSTIFAQACEGGCTGTCEGTCEGSCIGSCESGLGVA